MSVYYPAMSVNLIMRFDESLLSGASLSPKSAADLAESISLNLPGPVSKPGPLNGTKDRLSHIVSIIPRQATLELPAYRQAAKFSLTFAWRDLPIDPRAIRALGVEIYIGTVTANNFARGMSGQKDNGQLASYISQTKENLMFAGLVDNHSISFTDKGSEVKLDGRDLRAIYIDGKIDPATVKQLKVDQPIHEVVKNILSKAPQGANINVNVDPADWPNSIVPSPAAPQLVNRINKGADGKQSGHVPVKGDASSLSFWDIITNFCFLVGAVPYFRGYDLWIRPARSLFDQAKAGTKEGPNNPTPFKNGVKRSVPTSTGSSVDINFRRMVYGRNISTLNFERKLGGVKVPTVVCVSVDPSKEGTEKLLEVSWPDTKDGADPARVDAAKVTNVDPSGNSSGTEQLRIPVPAVKDKDRLRQIAQQVYEEIGRGELGGSCSSKDLASLGGDNADADIVRLRPGDAVEFLVDAAGVQGLPPVVSQLNTSASESIQQAAKELTALLGGRDDLAEVLVGSSRGAFKNLQNVFRVANVKYSWDAGSGIGVDFDFQNYIENRYDVQPSISVPSIDLSKVERIVDDYLKTQRQTPSKISSGGG